MVLSSCSLDAEMFDSETPMQACKQANEWVEPRRTKMRAVCGEHRHTRIGEIDRNGRDARRSERIVLCRVTAFEQLRPNLQLHLQLVSCLAGHRLLTGDHQRD